MSAATETVRMAVPPGRYFALAALCSGGLLAAALGFQYLGGLAPCELCLWQRIPYAAVFGAAILAILARRRLTSGAATWLAAACAASFFIDAGIAGFHVGVEQGWWTGSDACTAAGAPTGDLEALRDAVFSAPAVFCDEVAWSMFGLSMAAWNGVAALGLTAASVTVIVAWRR